MYLRNKGLEGMILDRLLIESLPCGMTYSYRLGGPISMANVEKISIALPAEMVAAVREAVATGEFASSSEVVRDALRDWIQKRTLRRQGLDELRQVWRQAMENTRPGVPMKDVLSRLERKYRHLSKSNSSKQDFSKPGE